MIIINQSIHGWFHRERYSTSEHIIYAYIHNVRLLIDLTDITVLIIYDSVEIQYFRSCEISAKYIIRIK